MSTQPNQPEPAVTNFCQNCGRPLTSETARTVGGNVLCEPCLAQRMGVPLPGQPVAGQPGPQGSGPFPYPPVRNSPGLAALLGFIPGVGAMYNGQVVKGLVHVLVFVALVSATDHFGPFGLLVAAWVFYQVFDAYQTAQALRMGMPPPDHLGINNIGARFGIGSASPHYTAPPAGYAPPQPYQAYQAGYPVPPVPPVAPVPAEYVPPPMGVAPLEYTAGAPGPVGEPGFPGVLDEPTHQSLPTGAFVLVGLGVLFLLGTAGVLSVHWITHGWPLILIGLGIWIFIRNNNRNRGGSL